ncbi:PAS domain-containing protein [Patescibacteria group bacterium]|nr:PAS domain-containing protein [Patescibacteria group bacterium]
MPNIKKLSRGPKASPPLGAQFFVELWEESWTYIRTVVDVLREPVLILDKNCMVLAANEAFYQLFQVGREETEGKIIYDLGNGQWNNIALRKLFEKILPKNSFFKGFEVEYDFPGIGKRTIVLNARHIYPGDRSTSELFPPIIMVAMEDVTQVVKKAKKLAEYTAELERTLTTRTRKLAVKIAILEKKLRAVSKH